MVVINEFDALDWREKIFANKINLTTVEAADRVGVVTNETYTEGNLYIKRRGNH